MSLALLKWLVIDSMLEFGVNMGETALAVNPRRWVGVEIEPQWWPDRKDWELIEADIYDWEPTGEKFDLVLCDAHEGVDSQDLRHITARQATLALGCTSKWIAVDNCDLSAIGAAARLVLGKPDIVCNDGSGCWIWVYPSYAGWN